MNPRNTIKEPGTLNNRPMRKSISILLAGILFSLLPIQRAVAQTTTLPLTGTQTMPVRQNEPNRAGRSERFDGSSPARRNTPVSPTPSGTCTRTGASHQTISSGTIHLYWNCAEALQS